MNIAFVLSRPEESGAFLLHSLIAPVTEAGSRIEYWLPGAAPESLPRIWRTSPDAVICGSAGGDAWDVRAADWQIRWLEGLWEERRPGLILFPAAGRELGIRLAARLDCPCFPETFSLLREGKRLFARKKVCGSNLDWDAEIKDYPAVLTVTGKRPDRDFGEGGAPRVEDRPAEPALPAWLLEYEQLEAFPANPLETAPLIFVAGRGLGSKAACDRLRRIAGHFGAPLGFSRPAALNGWGEIGEIIGQSGIRTGAELCVAVGVSGAGAFMVGIDSGTALIAVNPDRNARIFHYADIGIAAGAEEFMACLEEAGLRSPRG